KVQEEELLQTQQKLETIIESSLDGLLVIDKNGNVVFSNKAAEKILGRNPYSFIKSKIALPIKENLHTEIEITGENQNRRIIELNFNSISWEKEAMHLATIRDITEMNIIRQQLRNSEEFYRKLTEKNQDGILLLDNTGMIKYCAAGACKFIGLPCSAVRSSNIIDYIHPDHHENFREIFSKVLEKPNSVQKFVWKYHTKLFREVWFEGYIQNLLYDSVFNSVLINLRDITDLVSSKEELQKKASETELIYNAGKILNQSLDLETIFMNFNNIVSKIMVIDNLAITSYDSESDSLKIECEWEDKMSKDVSIHPLIKLDRSGKGLHAKVILKGKALLLNDYLNAISESKTIYTSSKGFIKAQDIDPSDKGAKSAIICPLHTKDSITGALHVFSYNYNTYTETDLRILQALSNHLAIVMANAKLYEKIQKELAERKRIEAELSLSEERFNAFMRHLPAVAWVTDKEHRFIYVNKEIESIKFKTNGSLLGKSLHEVEDAEIAPEHIANSEKVFKTGKAIQVIERAYRQDGTLGNYLVYKFPVFLVKEDMFIGGIAIDVTDRLLQEEELKSALYEKEILLKEIHHRVKNNLQIISSLISLQSNNTSSASTDFLQQTQDRVRSMALIHEQLYTSANIRSIDFEKYIKQLLSYLFSVYQNNGRSISYKVNTNKIELDPDTAIPMGLITNELVSNALKYAYKGKEKGKIEISIEPHDEINLKLTVKDDGIGLPEGFNLYNLNSLGLNLVEMLVNQLEGKWEIINKHGAKFVIIFKRPFVSPD
ncbi:MAG TPA: PAS domain S-box protein, partial [Ignavibacteria bacterium]